MLFSRSAVKDWIQEGCWSIETMLLSFSTVTFVTPTLHSHLTSPERRIPQCPGTVCFNKIWVCSCVHPAEQRIHVFAECNCRSCGCSRQQGEECCTARPAELFTLYQHISHSYILKVLVTLQTSCVSLLQTLFLL